MGNTLFPRKYRSIGKTQWNPLEVWVNTLAWNKLKKPVKGLERPGNRIARDFLGESVDQLDFLGLQDRAKRTALQSWLMECVKIFKTRFLKSTEIHEGPFLGERLAS